MTLFMKAIVNVYTTFYAIIQIIKPYITYNVYLKEQCYRWRVDIIRKEILYFMEYSGEFLKDYSQGEEHESFLPCEYYMHSFFL